MGNIHPCTFEQSYQEIFDKSLLTKDIFFCLIFIFYVYIYVKITGECLMLLFSHSVICDCDPMDCSRPGFPVLHYLLEFPQTHVHWVDDAIQHLILYHTLFSCPQSFPASGSFPVSQFFSSGGQSIGGSASVSVLPMNIRVDFL